MALLIRDGFWGIIPAGRLMLGKFPHLFSYTRFSRAMKFLRNYPIFAESSSFVFRSHSGTRLAKTDSLKHEGEENKSRNGSGSFGMGILSRFVFGVQILAADDTNQPPMVRLLSLRDGRVLVDPTQLVWVPLCTQFGYGWSASICGH